MGIILPFPARNKGRVRKSNSANAEGQLAIHQLGTADNVIVLNEQRDDLDGIDLLTAILHYTVNSLPREVRQQIRTRASAEAALSDDHRKRVAASMVALTFGGAA